MILKNTSHIQLDALRGIPDYRTDEHIMDQQLHRIQRANDATRAWRPRGKPADAAMCNSERRADVMAAILKV